MKTVEVDDYYSGRYWLFSVKPYWITAPMPCFFGTFETEDACLEYVFENEHEFQGAGFNILDIRSGGFLSTEDREFREVTSGSTGV